MPTMTAPATSSLLQRLKTSYSSGNSVVLNPSLTSSVTPISDPPPVDQIAGHPIAVSTIEPLVSSAAQTSVSDHLVTLDQVLSEVESQIPAQAVPLAVSQLPDPLNPPIVGGASSAKERLDAGISLDTSNFDVGGIQVVETERPHELPVEVEGFLQQVEQNQEQLPPEIVIATDMTQPYMPSQPLTPVVVLPITPEIEKAGGRKGPHWSVRWLVEWSRKLMKMFSGNVIYADSQPN